MDKQNKQNLRAPLHIHVVGPAVKNHRMPINDFIFLAKQVQVALERVAQVLSGKKESVRPGPKPADIKKYCTLEIVNISPGSLDLLCDLPPKDDLFEDLGAEALTAMIEGISHLASSNELPYGYDEGVLLALRESGEVFGRGIEKIEYDFQAPGVKKHIKAEYTPPLHRKLAKNVREPIKNQKSIEGRLLMGDFKESAYKCRLHPAVGKTVTCSFEEYQKEFILEALTRHVRLTGEDEEMKGEINEFKIKDIELLDAEINLKIDGESFFDRKIDLDELAKSQGVSEVKDFQKLLGDFWPEEEKADAFIAQVQEWRREGYERNNYL